MIAHNRKYESERSEVTTLKFDGDPTVNGIEKLRIVEKTEKSVKLSWEYDKTVEGFRVEITPDKDYPRIPGRITKDKTITIDNLAAGAKYTFVVNAFKKWFIGPKSHITVTTNGVTLPEVPLIGGELISATTVNLRWYVPEFGKKVAWTYGVYYGIEEEELYESEYC